MTTLIVYFAITWVILGATAITLDKYFPRPETRMFIAKKLKKDRKILVNNEPTTGKNKK